MKKIVVLIFSTLLFFTNSFAQNARQRWVDSVYNNLSEKERIGQMFMVAAYSGGQKYNQGQIQSLIDQRLIGGIIFMQGTAEAQATQTNIFQKTAKVPLLIGMDAEWGLGMRLTGVKNFPRQMMIGATRNTALMEQMATAIAYQCKRMGVHIDFAPDVDVNNNPDNPVINFRSFGDDKEWVSKLGAAYVKGLQDNGIMASAKHFPGHGDVATDSHLDLPIINKSKAQMQNLELYPFQQLINKNVQSVMIAHLSIPSLESDKNRPSTLSYNIVSNLLQKEMGFKGLVFTDALNMKGVTKYFPNGEADLQAFLAGNDVLLFSEDVPRAIAKIQDAIKSGKGLKERLEKSVKKILAAKYDAGLNQPQTVNPQNATEDLNRYTDAIFDNIAAAAITLVRDNNKILNKLALKPNGNYALLTLSKANAIQQDSPERLHTMLKKVFPNLRDFSFLKNQSTSEILPLVNNLKKFEAVIVTMQDLNLYPKDNYGLDAGQLAILKQLSTLGNTIIVDFGNAYALKYACGAGSALVTYEENLSTYKAAVEVLSGRKAALGQLPVQPCPGMRNAVSTQGSSYNYPSNNAPVLNNTAVVRTPAYEGAPIISNTGDMPIFKPDALLGLDRFITEAIGKGAFPGCQILAMKDGKVIFDKNYGRYSYGMNAPLITENTMYDVASVTKLASTTLAVMKLYEQGKINLGLTLGDYLPFVRGSNKAHIKISNVLLHQGGMKAWIPFYKTTVVDGAPNSEIYSAQKNAKYTIPVASGMYMNRQYVDTVWKTILESPITFPASYVYSDLDFLLLQQVVEAVTNMPLEEYVDKTFYKPLGLKNTMYNPWKSNLQARCAPTERDNYFRFQPLQGYVHDMAAAMLGGNTGHAGLFSTAQDIAVIMQMLLNGGTYGNKRFFTSETVDLFTGYRSNISRRGYGFDKPEKKAGDGGPASVYCSKKTFGHQGFTGTCAWADPQTGIVFVFLSNRVNPSADNNLITKLGIRTIAQDYIYQALGYGK